VVPFHVDAVAPRCVFLPPRLQFIVALAMSGGNICFSLVLCFEIGGDDCTRTKRVPDATNPSNESFVLHPLVCPHMWQLKALAQTHALASC